MPSSIPLASADHQSFFSFNPMRQEPPVPATALVQPASEKLIRLAQMATMNGLHNLMRAHADAMDSMEKALEDFVQVQTDIWNLLCTSTLADEQYDVREELESRGRKTIGWSYDRRIRNRQYNRNFDVMAHWCHSGYRCSRSSTLEDRIRYLTKRNRTCRTGSFLPHL